MPVTARLSRRFYEQFGDETTTELVEWFNAVDTTIQAQLREFIDLRFDRFSAEIDAKLERRFSEMDMKFERRFAEMDMKFERRFAEQDIKLEQGLARLDTKFTALIAHVETRLAWQMLATLITMLATLGMFAQQFWRHF